MNIIVFQIINYTLSFLMWMILGRVIVTLISGGKQTVISGLFQKVTEPVYAAVTALLPFARVPEEKKGTSWWMIGGCVPFFSIFIIVVLRFALILFFAPASR